jgi:hypothetical protein
LEVRFFDFPAGQRGITPHAKHKQKPLSVSKYCIIRNIRASAAASALWNALQSGSQAHPSFDAVADKRQQAAGVISDFFLRLSIEATA